MNNNIIPISTHIYDNPENLEQKAANFFETGLFFGGRCVHIINKMEGQICSVKCENIPLWKTIVKVVSFIASLGLIPFVLLIGKMLLRSIMPIHPKSISEQSIDVKPNQTANLIRKKINSLEQIGKKLLAEGKLNNGTRIKIRHHGKKYIFSKNGDENVKIQRVIRTLGRGGFGKVTELADTKTGKRSALKVATPSKPKVKKDYNSGALVAAERDLIKEAEHLKSLHCEGTSEGLQLPPLTSIFKIIKDYHSRSKERFGHESVVYDGSLDKLMTYQLPVETQMDIIRQIVKGVRHFREKGFVHNDLKPANIFYNKEGVNQYTVFVGDFGGAWKKGSSVGLAYTPHYTTKADISEVIDSKTEYGKIYSGKKFDIYSLGITISELLFGPLPSASKIYKDRMNKVLLQRGISQNQIDAFFKILDRMTIKEPDTDPLTEAFSAFFKPGSTRPSIKEIESAVTAITDQL